MNVVDALFVTFGLDPTAFQKGKKEVDADLKKLREEGDKTAKALAQQGKQASEFFRSVKVQLLGLLAVFGAATGLESFITSSIKGQAALGRLSTNLGMSASRLEAWSVVARETGAQGEDALSSLQTVASGLAEAAVKGHSAFTDTARANGIMLTDAKGHALDYEHVLLNVSARLKELPRQQALWLSTQLGVGAMFNTLMMGPSALQKRLDAAQQMSGLTNQSVKQAQELQKQWADVEERVKAAGDTLFAKLEPVLIRLGNELADFVNKIDWKKVGNDVNTWVGYANQLFHALGGVKGILLEITAIKLFGFMAGFAGNIAKLVQLTRVLRGVEKAAGAAAAAETAAAAGGGAAGAAGGGAAVATGGFARVISKFLGGATIFGLLRAAAFAPRPADTSIPDWKKKIADMHAQGAAEDAKYGGYWGSLMHALGLNPDATTSPPPLRAMPRKRSTPRADDNIDLFNGQFGSQSSAQTSALFSSLENKYGLPRGLLSKIYAAESNSGDPRYQVSPKGALGPFQFMPATAAQYGLKGNDVFSLDKSADAAARDLRDLLKMFNGSLPEAVAAYNYGQGNVQAHGLTDLPLETQQYLRKVLGDTQLGAAAAVPGNSQASVSTVETHIGQLNVHTRATDAKGISRDLHEDLMRNALIGQADTGLV